jgi:hypothetical protein
LGQDGAVRRQLVYLLAWVAATAVTAGVSWLGIRSVLSAASPPRSVSLAASDARWVAPPTAPGPTPRPSGPAATPSARPSPTDSWTPVANGRGGTAYRHTFRLAGGEVAVWCEDRSVRVLAATPKPGFVVNVTRLGEDGVQVSFTQQRRASRVLVRWWDGPYAEVTESVG